MTVFQQKYKLAPNTESLILSYANCVPVVFISVLFHRNHQGQLLEGVECHIYLYRFTFDDINLNRALVIIVLFPTKYSNKKVCANDIRK